ncbi:hypothetical protein ACJZ2D_002201 [Fusarium nematophilum]
MVNWKELGEIPDSEDDEGFESQELPSLAELVPANTNKSGRTDEAQEGTGANAQREVDGDIWAVPDSSQELNLPPLPVKTPSRRPGTTPQFEKPLDLSSCPAPTGTPSGVHDETPRPLNPPDLPNDLLSDLDPISSPLSSPLSSAQSDIYLPDVDSFEPKSITTENDSRTPSKSQPNPVTDDQILRSLAEQSSPPNVFTDDLNAVQPPLSLPQQYDSRPLTKSQELGSDAELQVDLQADVRYERSLRPRKPIQRHPYAFDDFLHKSMFKNAGIRPVRRPIEVEERQRQQALQKASQDNDFEDDSQETQLQDVSDESQPKGLEDMLDGLEDHFDMPSPSPPKTSPLNDQAGPSSQASSTGNTDNTSVTGEDLPTLQDLVRRPPTSTSKQQGKRKASSPRSSTRKRKRYDVVDSDPLEPAAILRLELGATDSPAAQRSWRRFGEGSKAVAQDSQHEPEGSATSFSTGQALPQPLARPTARQALVIPSDSEDELARPEPDFELTDGDHASETASESGSESGSEIVHTVGRRIRGVLPASWLRLDQQAGRDRMPKETHSRAFNHATEREMRRGVAQRRVAVPQASASPQVFFDDSDEDEPASREKTTDDLFHDQTRLVFEQQPLPIVAEELSDDGVSVIEDNHIDPMLTGRKRQLKLSESFRGTPKRSKSSNTQRKSLPPRGPHQPRITSMFPGTDDLALSATELVKEKYRQPTSRRKRKNGKKRTSQRRNIPAGPARLSILDVVEPEPPRFLKIAARSATRRRDMGRSNPGRKVIQLATREDHIDAVSVLNDWRRGAIQQRPSVTAARKAKSTRSRTPKQPLRETSGNTSSSLKRMPVPSSGAPRRLVKQVSQAGSVKYQSDGTAQGFPRRQLPRKTTHLARAGSGVTRPAQLEMDETDRTSRFSFKASKRHFDLLYRKQRGDLSASSILSFDNGPDTYYPASPPPEENPVPLRIVAEEPLEQPQNQTKSRFRKRTKPRRVDTEAPQFSHANDPIPAETTPAPAPTHPVESDGEKFRGLGPYGTQYTHHFETFPLDSRVYFHESTLIGSGSLESASSVTQCQQLQETRPRVSFSLGDQVLRWGRWDSQVSSELGVLLDSIADTLERIPEDGESSDSAFAVSSARFIMKFMTESLSLAEKTDAKAFACRAIEALQGFNTRVKTLLGRHDHNTGPRYTFIASVYDSLLVTSLLILRLCEDDTSLVNEKFQMGDLLKDLSITAISSLLMTGMDQVRKAYEELRTPRIRDRGLRDHTPTVHSWVVVMRVLDHAGIPRGSFWDILHEAMATPQSVASLDISEHERLWKNMFTLLPLTEFSDKGIIMAGRRHDVTVDGWTLPQKLLKRVFQVYKDNPRQSPSFNNYCRALVGRCHYLVQQWGWRRCVAVIGVIFDFFGSQNLAHLRNEEVYKSPKFLDELAGNPSLAVEEADKCFHIFLKLVALSIQKLNEINSLKDIRNLVARTMPNHNRQLPKEQNIHERDLAALRNHHDLLCTLFWASPAELRPPAHLIERLVTPESSHKEACLINLQAWNQLARFIVTCGEATTSFKPFAQWRNSFFQSVMRQFDSVQSDMQQQVLALSKDASNTISSEMIDALVAMNRTAVMDVLHLSVTASLDVMRHAPNLEAATFALNTLQLQQVFKHFGACPPQLDWSILRASLATLEVFLSRVDEFKNDEESQQSESQILDSAQADDAILVLDHDLSSSFFSMARCILSSRGDRGLSPSAAIECTELAGTLSARLGARFINGGLLRLSAMFKSGKYGLFEDVPSNLGLDQRRHLVLFMTTLLKNGFDDFDDAGFTLSEVWALSIVKPRQYLAYENQFAEELRRQQKEFVPEAVTSLAINPDYNTNRDLFEFTISWMRRSLRDAGPALKKIIKSEHSKTLTLVMQQIKGDLRTVAQNTTEHPGYVDFVRDIIALIRAHGSEICTVDDFFYQINKEYSPSVQDPQLQVAGMMSYGLRLSEGDTKVVHQLFFFLFNHFKMSLINDKLRDGVTLLRKGMENPGILSFILGKMLPAIIQAAVTESSVFPMVDVYSEALRITWSQSVVPRELTEDDTPPLLVMMRAFVRCLDEFGQRDGFLAADQVHLVAQLLSMSNKLWPSLHGLALSQTSFSPWKEMTQILKDARNGFLRAESYLSDLVELEDYSVDAGLLLSGFRSHSMMPSQVDNNIKDFKDSIINDVRRNWVTNGTRITAQAPGRGQSSTQSGQGTPSPLWNAEELVKDLHEQVRAWNYWWNEVFGGEGNCIKSYPSVLF